MITTITIRMTQTGIQIGNQIITAAKAEIESGFLTYSSLKNDKMNSPIKSRNIETTAQNKSDMIYCD